VSQERKLHILRNLKKKSKPGRYNKIDKVRYSINEFCVPKIYRQAQEPSLFDKYDDGILDDDVWRCFGSEFRKA
jgi:hypothetical protein